MAAEQWPPNYMDEYSRRLRVLKNIKADPELRHRCMVFYQKNPVVWIQDWCQTYDPRARGLKTMPFVLFKRQRQYIDFLYGCMNDRESGLVEKCRDAGVTWLSCAFSVWAWQFIPGASIGWGSRKEQLVDKLGDPDSIFEKIRMIVRGIPPIMMPSGFDEKRHSNYMKLINPENGATITGEAGDNIGRGGRKMIYFKDESAHYERPELIEAALGDNTDVQIDISSVHGTGNVFYRRRHAGAIWLPGKPMPKAKTRVFIFDWRDHPAKTQEWYNLRYAKMESEGLRHIFAQEVDRDYSSAVDKVICPALWVKASIDAHIKLGFGPTGVKIAAQDIADEGGDKNALGIRDGVILQVADHWGEGDTGETARRSVSQVAAAGCRELYYDSIGVGAGFKSETNRLRRDNELPGKMLILPWSAGANPLNPNDHLIPGDMQSPKNGDFFENLSAQAAWLLRMRFEKTYKAVVQGHSIDPADLISLPSTLPNLHELVAELSQPTFDYSKKGKLMVVKKGEGMKSPNLADVVKMCYCPTKEVSILDVL